MEECCRTLQQFDVAYEARVLSAHRTPQAASEFVSGGEARGLKVFIAAAGGAAHLAGVVAAHTVLRFSEYRWRVRPSRVWIRYYQPSRCPPEFRLVP